MCARQGDEFRPIYDFLLSRFNKQSDTTRLSGYLLSSTSKKILYWEGVSYQNFSAASALDEMRDVYDEDRPSGVDVFTSEFYWEVVLLKIVN